MRKKCQDKPGKETGRTWRKSNRARPALIQLSHGGVFGRGGCFLVENNSILAVFGGDLWSSGNTVFGASKERFFYSFQNWIGEFSLNNFWNRPDDKEPTLYASFQTWKVPQKVLCEKVSLNLNINLLEKLFSCFALFPIPLFVFIDF